MFGQPATSEVASRMINLDDIFADCFFGPVGEVLPSTSIPGVSGAGGGGAGGGMGAVPSSSAASTLGSGGGYEDDEYDDEEEEDEHGVKRPRSRPQQMRGMSEQQKVERRCVRTV
jgi:hypothetical protein